MRQKVDKTEKERFDRMLFGIPEEEYPSDALDAAILRAVKGKLLTGEPISETLLFSADSAELQIYKRTYAKANAVLVIEPDLAEVALLNQIPNIDASKSIPIEIYSSLPQDVELFNGLDFTAILTIEDWINQEVYREMATYSPLRSIFE